MSVVSQTLSSTNPVVLVKFLESCELPPLTTVGRCVAQDVERYLQRCFYGSLDVTVHEKTGVGTVCHNGVCVAAFTVTPIGGAR